MNNPERESQIVIEALYEWHNRKLSNNVVSALICSISINHIYQLSHFAKQGVKVRLK